MKYILIKENQKIQLINAVYYRVGGNRYSSKDRCVCIGNNCITTEIFTDGKIKSIEEAETYSPKIQRAIDKENINEVVDLELEDFNYAIKVLSVYKKLSNGSGGTGMHEFIKSIEVYLKDKNDKDIMRQIKETLKVIRKYQQQLYYSVQLTHYDNHEVKYEKQDMNVYTLVKKK